MIPRNIKFGNEQLNVLAYTDDIVLTVKNETEIRQFCRDRKHCKKVRTTHKRRKNKMHDGGTKIQLRTK